jgi:hypothetical protein
MHSRVAAPRTGRKWMQLWVIAVEFGAHVVEETNRQHAITRDYATASTLTPFQNAIRSLTRSAASLGSG